MGRVRADEHTEGLFRLPRLEVFGGRTSVVPYGVRSKQPKSSQINITKLGLVAAEASPAAVSSMANPKNDRKNIGPPVQERSKSKAKAQTNLNRRKRRKQRGGNS